MASDYTSIRADNQRRYGTDIGRIGPILLADRYDDRTHFIFELLQNAEDALARRAKWQGSRAVSFHLTETQLYVSHFGQLFNEADVRGICGIAESTKTLTAIGRFGIGFKSVYAFTDRPEVHSGTEDFAIESFVWPVGVQRISRDHDETLFALPLRPSDSQALDDVSRGLRRLGATALLFLRQIEEVRWKVEGGDEGLYLRQSKEIEPEVRRATVIGQEQGKHEIHEEWLVFSRPVTRDGGHHASDVEIAFSIAEKESGHEGIQRVDRSPLVVFFPTVLETHLGFLLQGPYRTTPSRDNVPRNDAWNQRLVDETGSLLLEALRWLRGHDLLDTAALRCLPLDPMKFGETSMFAPLFQATKNALSSEPLLPRFDGGHAPVARARLGRTKEVRELFTPSQLVAFFGEEAELCWLSGDISQDRTPDLRRYLMQELGVTEITPETIIPWLDEAFLAAQSDAWIVSLYEFLNGQPALLRRLDDLKLIRLEDGSHVRARADGQPQAFLPGTITTGFPTVRLSVCATETACKFLRSLGLTEPDPVDDVVRNVLPKYRDDEVDLGDAQYEANIRRMLTAFATDSKAQREKLIAALRETPFVMAIDGGDGSKRISRPSEVYIATERLKELFAGVEGILLVDGEYSCLRGEAVRELLEVCGAVRYLRPVEESKWRSWEQREWLQELRTRAGHPETSGQNDRITDWSLLGLKGVVDALPKAVVDQRRTKAKLLWEELAHLEERRGKGIFTGEYTWTHYGSYRTSFDALFVRVLTATEWVPDDDGNLLRSDLVLFDSLGWKPNPFLQSKIQFKPPILDQLAKEAGVELGVLDLLKRLGVTSEAELRARLGVDDESTAEQDEAATSVDEPRKEPVGGPPEPTRPVPDAASPERAPSGGGSVRSVPRSGTGSSREYTEGKGGHGDWEEGDRVKGSSQARGKRTPGSDGGRPFISYVGTHRDEEEVDPDGLDHSSRMVLEARAIELILAREPNWERTPAFNPGYDLFKTGPDGQPNRWCEVKAMTGSLHDRPVGLSHTQFECAREHGSTFWLYVVEHASTERARIVRIQDPAGKARTFTFDRGWIVVAQLDNPVD